MSNVTSLVLIILFPIIAFLVARLYSQKLEKVRKAYTKDGKLIYVDSKTGERFEDDPQKPLKKIVGGVILILLALSLYLLIISPHNREMLSDDEIAVSTLITLVIAGIGLVGTVILALGIGSYNKGKNLAPPIQK